MKNIHIRSFSGSQYFPAFGPNTECGKIRSKKTPKTALFTQWFRIQKSGLGRNLGKNLTILLGFNFINLAFSKIEDERTHFDNACEIYNLSFMNYNL